MEDDEALSPLTSVPEHMRQSLPHATSTQSREGNPVPGQHIRLACQACQRKKIKCDRIYPCGQCARSNLQCVPSQRKPRARHAGKRAVDSELRSRISKLESLVETLSGEVALQHELSDDQLPDGSTPESGSGPRQVPTYASPSNSSEVASAKSPSLRRYVGSSFWESLTDEVQALREALEDDDDDEHAEDDHDGAHHAPVNGSTQEAGHDYDLLIGPAGRVFTMPGVLTEPPLQTQMALYDWYATSVAMVYRLHHMPSLFRFLKQGQPYLGYSAQSAPCKAVKAAIWFATVNAGSNEDCLARIGRPRDELIREYRRFVDLALCQAELIMTTDIPTLQAAVTFLLSTRINDCSRRAWTLTALIVRIAQAMNLSTEFAHHSPYQKEIRRRLWYEIRFLDSMAANDRSTMPLLRFEVNDIPFPSNVNDEEFDENSTHIIPHETGITDMSFCLLTFEAGIYNERLNRPENKPGSDTWQRRLELAKEFDLVVEEKFRKYCDTSIPFHRLIDSVSQAISSSIILRAVRPPQKQKLSSPPRVDSPYVLSIATNCLRTRHHVHHDKEIQHWSWLVWVHWHALAVALAGLCSIRGTELAKQAWYYVEESYERLKSEIADTRNGMLWRPIEKLHRRAVAFRDGHDLSGTHTSLSSPVAAATPRTASQSLATSSSNGPPAAPVVAQAWTMSPTMNTSDGAYFAGNGLTTAPNLAIDPNLMGYMMASSMASNSPIAARTASLGSGSVAPGLAPLSTSDPSWLDWERMMQDMPDLEFNGDALANAQLGGDQFGGVDPMAQHSSFLF